MIECKFLLVETNNEKGEDMKDNCVCPRIYMPVCGEDGETYPNTCNADCAGTEVQCDGKCPCSTDGNGTDYRCCGEVAWAEVQCDGKCPCSNDGIGQDYGCPYLCPWF